VLEESVRNGDQDTVKTLAYLAFLNPAEANQIVDGFLAALGGKEEIRQAGVESFEYLRRVSPDLASSQAERLLHELSTDPISKVWSIEASGLLADDPNKALERAMQLFSQ
jgi:hypothetical protein